MELECLSELSRADKLQLQRGNSTQPTFTRVLKLITNNGGDEDAQLQVYKVAKILKGVNGLYVKMAGDTAYILLRQEQERREGLEALEGGLEAFQREMQEFNAKKLKYQGNL